MGNRIAKVLDISGQYSETPDFPVAVVREAQEILVNGEKLSPDTSTVGYEGKIVDPVFDWHITKNLFGRVMTLVEATTDMHKLSAVKDLFAKELRNWEDDVYSSARELANGGDSSSNLYTKHSIK